MSLLGNNSVKTLLAKIVLRIILWLLRKYLNGEDYKRVSHVINKANGQEGSRVS